MPALASRCPSSGTEGPYVWPSETTVPPCRVSDLQTLTYTGEGSPSLLSCHARSGFCPPPTAAHSHGPCSKPPGHACHPVAGRTTPHTFREQRQHRQGHLSLDPPLKYLSVVSA